MNTLDTTVFTLEHLLALMMALHKRLGENSLLRLLDNDTVHAILWHVCAPPRNIFFLLFWGPMDTSHIVTKGVGATRGAGATRGGGSSPDISSQPKLDEFMRQNVRSFGLQTADESIVPLQAVPQSTDSETAEYLQAIGKKVAGTKVSRSHPTLLLPERTMWTPTEPLQPGDFMLCAICKELTADMDNTRSEYQLLGHKQMLAFIECMQEGREPNYENFGQNWQLQKHDGEFDPHGLCQQPAENIEIYGIGFEYPDEMRSFSVTQNSKAMAMTAEGGVQAPLTVGEGTLTMSTLVTCRRSENDLVPEGQVYCLPIKIPAF
jgi:hypothetical protein